jgi:hypothetical protein
VTPLDLKRLALVPPASYGDLRFSVAPCVRLIDTGWPILAIWEANKAEGDLPDDFDLNSGGDWLLVRREGFDCMVQWLEEADFELLAGCLAGETLTEAFERPAIASLDDPGSYLLMALQRFVPIGVLYDFSLAESHAGA